VSALKLTFEPLSANVYMYNSRNQKWMHLTPNLNQPKRHADVAFLAISGRASGKGEKKGVVWTLSETRPLTR
jgi:hypothetical protein